MPTRNPRRLGVRTRSAVCRRPRSAQWSSHHRHGRPPVEAVVVGRVDATASRSTGCSHSEGGVTPSSGAAAL